MDTACQASLDAAESVLLYLEEIRKRKSYLTLHEWLFLALAEKTKELATAEIASEDLLFDPEDLVEWLKQHSEKNRQLPRTLIVQNILLNIRGQTGQANAL